MYVCLIPACAAVQVMSALFKNVAPRKLLVQEEFFLDYLTFEYETYTLSRNVGKKIPNYEEHHIRRAKASNTMPGRRIFA